ncbi:MAG TPA: serine hydrolase domain-containing protein, partial [Fimbriimonas sp.]|nr:serine hydrolase domain-containing protein [Fimbriimonas sp.]
KLAEQGKLSFEDTVGKFLPDYPNSDVAKKVTVNQLLTHTSGLESHSLGALRRGYRTLKEYLPTFDQFSPKFEPGTQYAYSNDGYLLLGLIIEKVSGESFYDYVRKNIYLPAGMKSTDCYELDAGTENLATGYMDGPNNSRRDNIFALPIKGLPYGLGYSTVGDLLKFDTALRNHSILSAQSTKELWEGKVKEGDQRTQYGYGFDIADFNGTRYVGHSGGWAGITDQMDMYLDCSYTVVILTNYDDSPRGIAFKLREWLTQGLRE